MGCLLCSERLPARRAISIHQDEDGPPASNFFRLALTDGESDILSGNINHAILFLETPMNLFIFWIIQSPLAYLLSIELAIEAVGVYWAIVISETIFTIVGYFLFKRDK